MLIYLLSSLFFTIGDFYCWKKYRDRNFLFISLSGAVVTFVIILGYITNRFIFSSSILTTLLLIVGSWYGWRKFKDAAYLWVSILTGIVLLIKIYKRYFNEHINQFSLQYRAISTTSISALLFLIIVTIIVAFIVTRKK